MYGIKYQISIFFILYSSFPPSRSWCPGWGGTTRWMEDGEVQVQGLLLGWQWRCPLVNSAHDTYPLPDLRQRHFLWFPITVKSSCLRSGASSLEPFQSVTRVSEARGSHLESLDNLKSRTISSLLIGPKFYSDLRGPYKSGVLLHQTVNVEKRKKFLFSTNNLPDIEE